jgi:hypothetical protein
VLADFRVKGFLLSVGNDGSTDGAVFAVFTTFKNAHHGGFVFASGAGDLAGANVLVHVPSLLPDEGFVGFDFAGEFFERSGVERKADSVIHEPSRLLGYADGLSYFVRADAVLAVHNLPDREQPLIQRNRGVFEDGSGFQAEARAIMFPIAFPDSGIFKPSDLF